MSFCGTETKKISIEFHRLQIAQCETNLCINISIVFWTFWLYPTKFMLKILCVNESNWKWKFLIVEIISFFGKLNLLLYKLHFLTNNIRKFAAPYTSGSQRSVPFPQTILAQQSETESCTIWKLWKLIDKTLCHWNCLRFRKWRKASVCIVKCTFSVWC